MLGVVGDVQRVARVFTVQGDGRKRNEDAVENQDDIGPLMSDDRSVSMVTSCGVFGMESGTGLERGINHNGDFPGQALQLFEHRPKSFGVPFGEVIQGIGGNAKVIASQCAELRRIESRHGGGNMEGMFTSVHHQRHEIPEAQDQYTKSDIDVMKYPISSLITSHRLPVCWGKYVYGDSTQEETFRTGGLWQQKR